MKPIGACEIVIGFSTSMSLISRLIRFFEDAPFSHVYVRYYSTSLDRNMIYHADINDVYFINESKFLTKNEVVEEYVFAVTPETKRAVIQKCIDRLNIRYGKLQLIGMAVAQALSKWSGRLVGNPFGADTQVCSELAGHVLREMGFDIDEAMLKVYGPKWLNGEILHLCELNHCRKI